MIDVENLSFSYNEKSVLRFPNFKVEAGEPCLLLGESGSGKTTLLHVLGGLLRGYQGTINLNGQGLSSLSEKELDNFRGRNIGFIFQKNHLITALTVEQNLHLAPYLAGAKVSNDRLRHLLHRLGIEQIQKSSVTEISQGQAQRVAIARAVMHNPVVILADEPTSALDDKSCDQVIKLLLEVANENKATLIIATHDQRLKNNIGKQIQLVTQQK